MSFSPCEFFFGLGSTLFYPAFDKGVEITSDNYYALGDRSNIS